MNQTIATAALRATLLMLPAAAQAALVHPPAETATGVPAEWAPDLAHHDPQIRLAEDAVRSNAGRAQSWLALGKAYFVAGRFQSAETALVGALHLDPLLEGAELRLVLVQLALGKKAEALARLDAMAVEGREDDIGLARALAGDIGRGRQMLAEAARDARATPRLRQNLAFVEALAGRWADAATIAAQDVPPGYMAERLRRWAMIAQMRDAPALQIGALVGVVPQVDPGMPVHLALTDGPVRSASADTPVDTPPVVVASASLQPDVVRPVAYSGPPRMRTTRDVEIRPDEALSAPEAGRTNGRPLFRTGSRRGMTLSARAIHSPVRSAAVCTSNAMAVLGRGRLQKISLYGKPRPIRSHGGLRSA